MMHTASRTSERHMSGLRIRSKVVEALAWLYEMERGSLAGSTDICCRAHALVKHLGNAGYCKHQYKGAT